MQVTLVSAYSLRLVLRDNARGIRVCGLTVRPGYSNGLAIGARPPAPQHPLFSR